MSSTDLCHQTIHVLGSPDHSARPEVVDQMDRCPKGLMDQQVARHNGHKTKHEAILRQYAPRPLDVPAWYAFALLLRGLASLSLTSQQRCHRLF